ncbi:MAG TPA: DNA translocase FtsK [Candidatus Marinimicrobia bacterium]|nr:DNA translocase FtsK [Candidatus Neomarinimicrobiota bacterium]
MNNRQQEILGILLIALGILIMLSLISYNPIEEPTISKNVAIQNWMGIMGVYISHFLIKYTIGVAVFILPVLMFVWGWWLFADKERKILIRFSLYSIFMALLVSVALGLPAVRENVDSNFGFRYSGLVGGVFAKVMCDWLGFTGTVIVLLVLALVTIRGYFTWSFYSPIARWRSHRRSKKERTSGEIPQPRIPERQFSVSQPEKDAAVVQPETEATRQVKIKKSIETQPPIIEPKVEPVTKSETSGGVYQLPPIDLLELPPESRDSVTKEEMAENAQLLENALETFGVKGKVVNVSPGPIITRYEIEPAVGVRVSKIAALADDLARILSAKRIRIVAPIPGKSVVGVEIPNRNPEIVYLRSIIGSRQFASAKSKLTIALGKTTSGEIYTLDLARMPHLLIAGATGSGKSVCINTIIASLLYLARPDEVKFMLIDPKKLELSIFKALEGYHLITCEDLDEDVITRADNAIVALRSVELEMERRYEILASATVRNIDEYNNRVVSGELDKEFLPYIIIVIDELADLMLTSAKEVEEPITRLAQMARAVGIHLIIATQRPSVDVITGVIKANFPARIAFQVASKIDSRTILDLNGAEKLLGRGDLLITTPQNPEPFRVHSAYISLEEIERILEHIENQPRPGQVELPSVKEESVEEFGLYDDSEKDPLYYEALRLVVTHQQGSISLLQRRLKIGYSRAARLIDELEKAGIVGEFTGSKARDVLVDEDYLEQLNKTQNDEDEV